MNAAMIRFALGNHNDANSEARMMTAAADPTEQLLRDGTVVIIGPDALAQPYVTEFETLGARALKCPSVEVVDLESHERLDEALEHLYGYDWLLFTSVHGADYFVRRLQEKGREFDAIDDLRVCAIGEATEQFLREIQVHVDVAPLNPQTHQVFAALGQFVGGNTGFSGLNFLTPRAASGSDSLTRALTAVGARVDVVPAYRVSVRNGPDAGRTAAMLAGQADCILLTTPDSVNSLAQLFDAHDLGEVLGKVLVAATDELAAQASAQYGLQVSVLPAQAKATAQAIAELFSTT